MDTSDTIYEEPVEGRQTAAKADLSNRAIAKTIDFIIVVVLYEIIPAVGFFAGLLYLLIADGLFQGRSAGKRIIGLKVIILDQPAWASACGFKESAIRNSTFAAAYILYGIFHAVPLMGWLVSIVVVAVVLVFEGLVTLGSDEGMRMGDELAKTQVVEDRDGRLNV